MPVSEEFVVETVALKRFSSKYFGFASSVSFHQKALSELDLTTETWVQSHTSKSGICGGNSGIEKVFFQVLWLCPISIIPSEGTFRTGSHH
jgi:hypothetical protein